MKTTKSISVVIPNFCGKSLLEKYLPPLFEALSNSEKVSDWEVIVVDDASTDDSVSFLKEQYSTVVLLKNEVNSGFSITCNKGIFAATKELVFVLNSDMYVPLNLFDILCPVFINEKDVFGVFPTVKDMSGEKILESQKIPKHKPGSIHYVDNIAQDQLSYSLYLCGGNALIDREKLISLNGYNTIYSPFYFEDFDLSLRAWRKGWKSYYSPDTYSLHCHSATVNEHFNKTYVTEIFIRNKLIFNYLYTEGFQHSLFVFNLYLNLIKSFLSFKPSKKSYFNASLKFFEKIAEVKMQRKKEFQPLNKYFESIFTHTPSR